MEQRNEPVNRTGWYIVQCKPSKEHAAAAALRSQFGVKVYLPLAKARIRGRTQRRPFFPGYLFVRANLRDITTRDINTVPSILRVVTFGDTVPSLSVATMAALHQRIMQLNQRSSIAGKRFQPGDPVRLKTGPLQGLEAIFIRGLKASERVRVLIEFLGATRETDVPVDALEQAPAAARAPQRLRYTRGKGRKTKMHS